MHAHQAAVSLIDYPRQIPCRRESLSTRAGLCIIFSHARITVPRYVFHVTWVVPWRTTRTYLQMRPYWITNTSGTLVKLGQKYVPQTIGFWTYQYHRRKLSDQSKPQGPQRCQESVKLAYSKDPPQGWNGSLYGC